jgi:NDP-hexose C3-ketoreductase / dTDP-4-oxo-2-deoxy-alpha-D-pentos-2-ene 2,3-reductase
MDYTPLGRTGLLVSKLCLGTTNFGPETSETDSFAIIDKALDLGINFFDTANVYGWKKGEGVTEQIVGRWFAEGSLRALEIKFSEDQLKTVGDIWPGPGGEAPEAYAW